MTRTAVSLSMLILAMGGFAPAATVFDDAVAYWPFEGTGSTVTDESLTTAIDLQFGAVDLLRVDGVVGQAIQSLDATQLVTSGGDVDALDLSQNDEFTWAGWVNKQSSAVALSSKMLSSNPYRGWWIYGRDDGALDFLLRSENTAARRIWLRAEAGTLTDYTWSHLTVTFAYDAADPTLGVRMYSNGEERSLSFVSSSYGADFETGLPTDNDAPFNMFGRNNTGLGDGCLDEVAVWNRVLSQAEIDELVAAAGGPPERPEGNYLVNGDFEDVAGWGVPGSAEFPAGWGQTARKNAASQMTGTGAIGGSGTSAYLEAFYSTDNNTRRELFQYTTMATLPEWQFDVDFVCEDPDATATDRAFNVSLHHDGGILSLRVVDSDSNGIGDMEYYDAAGSGWTPITELANSVIFDDDVYIDPATHKLTVVGDYTTDEPAFDVMLTNSDGMEFTATGLSGFITGAPSAGAGVTAVQFPTFTSLGGYVVDNVSLTDLVVPEPGVAMLLACAAVLVVLRRK